jgi:hypothetical protein
MTTGTESRYALKIPVKEFAAPPPVVTSDTPVFPVILAYPCASITAACSWWEYTIFIEPCLTIASITARLPAPDMQKITYTPLSTSS